MNRNLSPDEFPDFAQWRTDHSGTEADYNYERGLAVGPQEEDFEQAENEDFEREYQWRQANPKLAKIRDMPDLTDEQRGPMSPSPHAHAGPPRYKR